jgi:HAAS
MTIAEYLEQLERRLQRFGRRRALAEAEAHLRDSAARHEAAGLTRTAAEAAAIRDFGDVAVVARRFAAETAIRETRAATALALGAVVFFVFPLYVVPENTLPPATWDEKPTDILVLQLATISLWGVAGALAAAGSVLAWTRWLRFAAPALELVLRALAGSILLSAVLVVRWFTAAPDTVLWPLLAAPLAVACLAVCAEAAGWAHSRRCRLVPD